MEWDEQIDEYHCYLTLEKKLSANSIEAYMRDISLFRAYIRDGNSISPEQVAYEHIQGFMAYLYDKGMSAATQARIVSGVKSFYNFLLINDKIDILPTENVESVRIRRKLPDVLRLDEIEDMLGSIDLSKPYGHRNKAILETLYSCGLRVSELIHLKISDLFFDDGFIRVVGKGDKQRLVPVSDEAVKLIQLYLDSRKGMTVQKKYADCLYLNNRGAGLSRIMVFNIIKEVALKAGISKKVSPHTFRHSFATHLMQGGADLRFIQYMLGHESVMTTEIYTHLNTSFLHRSIRKYHPVSTECKKT